MSALSLSKKKKEPKPPKPPKEKKAKKEKAPKKPKAPKEPKVKKMKTKVRADVYTLILLLAWLAMVAACIMLYLDVTSYPKP